MPRETQRTSVRVASERAALVAVHLPDSRFDPEDPLGELRSLARTAGAEPACELVQRRQRPESATYIGSGKLNELKAACDETRASVVIFDNDLSPAQIRNIERTLERKIIDRSELILDIFASRAATHEAKLQVELAQLEYTYPRLRAMWDHLERIVGVGGVAGIGARGPGEQQLEIDRRLVQRRRAMLRRELSEIEQRKRRAVQKRKKDHFTVGLVGYTNAGKSTLFNALTAGGAYADDRLFSTLMTRTREWDAGKRAGEGSGGGEIVMLSDTVGFVRDLPHNLVASFKATLEEVTHADLLLVVLDISDPAAELQHETVSSTIDELFEEARELDASEGIEYTPPERVLVLNKTDKLADNAAILEWTSRFPGAIPISAKDAEGGGLRALARRVLAAAVGDLRDYVITVTLTDSRTIHVIESRAEVRDREYVNGEVRLHARIGERQLAQLRAGGARMRVAPAAG